MNDSEKLTIGDEVTHKNRQARVVATSGLDKECIVQYLTLDEKVQTSGWISQEKVTRV